MASVHKVVLANGIRWRARYRTPEGGSRTRTFDRKVDAEAFLATTEHSKLTGAYIDRAAGAVTFEAFAEEWRAAQVHRATTAAQVEGNLRRHVYPTIGRIPLGQICTSTIQGLVKTLSADLAPGTVEVIYRYVSAIFKAAVADRMIASSPCVRVRLPKAPPSKVVPITVEQVRALEAALPAKYAALVPLCAGTGLRQGEAFGLTADRIDFLRRTLVVDRQLVLLPSTGPTFGPPKTPSSYRTIPAADVVLEALAAHIAEHGTGDDGLLFTNTVGGPIRRTRFSEVWRPAARAAGLPE